jgi:hypothetical protein
MPAAKFLVPTEIVPVASQREFRDATRHPCNPNYLIRLLVRPSFRNLRAFVNDLSVTGIGLLINRTLEIGSTLALQLVRDPLHSLIRIARVVHCTEQPDGWWLVGSRFTVPLPEKELRALLET